MKPIITYKYYKSIENNLNSSILHFWNTTFSLQLIETCSQNLLAKQVGITFSNIFF